MRHFCKLTRSLRFALTASLVAALIMAVNLLGMATVGFSQTVSPPASPTVVATPSPKGAFKVAYKPVTRERSVNRQKKFQKDQTFEQLATKLNNLFILPRDVTIVLGDCGVENAFYNPQDHSINICYELIDHFTTLFLSRQKGDSLTEKQRLKVAEQAAGTVIFTFFHELGHALIAELELPTTGKEEDAVDTFSALFLSSSDKTIWTLKPAAIWFAYESEKNKTIASLPFWDEHSLTQQRFYGIICFLEGKDYATYHKLAEDAGIPKQRQAKCLREYAKQRKAWNTLLKPYIKIKHSLF